VTINHLSPDQGLDAMLVNGEIDALFTAHVPPSARKHPDSVQRLFPDFEPVERDYFRRTGIFPIMHTVVIRRELYQQYPWVAQSLHKAFVASKKIAADMYAQTAAMTSMLPWTSAHAEEARTEMGEDWWPYGLGPNRHVLETFLRYHHEQGLSKRLFKPEELFARETLESFKV
jgi:4,5-dihydroxyphthalate decarboxylase